MSNLFRLGPRFCRVAFAAILFPASCFAGGPKYVAGTTYFNPGVAGQPVHWANGRLAYFIDQGPLSATVSNQQAAAMVDAAAALWSSVPTAAVALSNQGFLNEDVSGSNVIPGVRSIAQPSDVSPASAYPIGVVFDADGSVLDAVLGTGTSDPSNCESTGVMVLLDNILPDATIAHALLIVNGRCTDTPQRLQMLSFLLERGFGIVLGLGDSQVFPRALANGDSQAAQGWPVMQPQAGICGAAGGTCIPNPAKLSYDDIASLNRLYPVTAANLPSFPGKMLTAANTVSVQGNISFRAGSGMQGVNVIARPLDSNGNPMDAYAVTFVSGAYFSGNHGNDVTGWTGSDGLPLAQWGSEDASLQGFFDLSCMPLPPGVASAAYQLTFERVDPLYIEQMAVGPYVPGSPTPSGTLNPVTTNSLAPGQSQTFALNIADSAVVNSQTVIATESEPRLLSPSGLWGGTLSRVGQTDWFNFPVRGNRTFTVVTVALDEEGLPTGSKAMPAIGVWDAFAPVGAASVGTSPGLNGFAAGESWLRVTSSGDDLVRLGIADMRGDGRPDYVYTAWVLYADSVAPQRLPACGGPIVIHGMGFRPLDTVLVNGQQAQVTSVTPNEITAIAPPSAPGVTGSVDLEVDDDPMYSAAAVLTGGVSYDAGTTDSLTLVTAPSGVVPVSVPIPFSVTALAADLTPAGGVTVLYAVTSGNATLGCGQTICSVTAGGDGNASMTVIAADATASVVTASLTNGASLQAHFAGGAAPVLTALNPFVSVAAGATLNWTAQALVLQNGTPAPGQTVSWQPASGVQLAGNNAALSAASGIAVKILAVGPLQRGQQATVSACLNGTLQCATFVAQGARPEYAYLEAVSGTSQSVRTGASFAPLVLRVRDMNGNPMAGGTVTLSQSVYAWEPPCPPQGRCAQAQLLSTQTSSAISGLDGTVQFAPAASTGVATTVVGIAATGNTSTLAVTLEQHP